jgi:hypothetical protein
MTLEELCAGMSASGRPLTERAARDWWSKGLLPRPRRKGLGKGRGTATYWTDPRVAAQAEATYDFLAMHSRTYSAAVHLWLSGFPVELTLVRGAYHRLIGRHFRSMQRHTQEDPDARLGALAAQISRHMVKEERVPLKLRDDVTDLAVPFLETFFKVNWVFDGEGLSELWDRVEPYLWDTKVAGSLALNDHQLKLVAGYLRRMGSLPAQRDAIRSASDYELIRARRLLLFVFGHVRRMADLASPNHPLDAFCRNGSLALSRPAVPILIMVLREDWLRHRIMEYLFLAAVKVRQGMRSGVFDPELFPVGSRK